jgi:transposase
MPSNKTRKSILQERAKKYSEAGWLTSDIANELGVHAATVRRWLKPMGLVGLAGNPYSKKSKEKKGLLAQAADEVVPIYKNEDLPGTVEDTLKIAKHDARLAEDEQIAGVSEAHDDPKLAYKNFMVNMGMKKMRDGLMSMPPPRTIKEAEVLDQIIRRNADMDPKRGGSGGGTTIDISILNNPHTALTPGGVLIKAKRVSSKSSSAKMIETSEDNHDDIIDVEAETFGDNNEEDHDDQD